MAQVTEDMARRIIEKADRYEWYEITLGELRQLAYGWLQWRKNTPAVPPPADSHITDAEDARDVRDA